MTLPRQVLPGTTYLITRRVAQRELLLKPTTKTKQVVDYAFHRAAAMHAVELHALQVLDNHYHAVVTDTEARLPEFMAWVDREIAKALNQHYGRAENFWSDDHYSAVVLHDREAVLDKLEYVFCNVVEALIVRDYRDWPGITSSPRDWLAPPRTVERPDFYFNQRDTRWKQVAARYTVPPALRDRDPETLIVEMENRIAERQKRIVAEAKRKQKPFLGLARHEKLSPFDFPKSKRVKGRLNPTFAAGTAEGQRRARAMLRHFRSAYREALALWRKGLECMFPAGCYWHARFACVCVAPLETACPAVDTT